MTFTDTGFNVTGYDPYEWFFASRYRQGERTVYSIDFSVRELVTFLPKPDPDRQLDASSTQRRIVPAHAKGFADYICEEKGWVSPALLLRGPSIFKFDIPAQLSDLKTGTTHFGVLGVPKDAKAEIQIIDGQHRTLGFHLAWEKLTEVIVKARTFLADAKAQGEPAVVANAQAKLDEAIGRRDQLAGERVSVQLVVVEHPNEARQIFVDINDNAKGISGSVRSRFDDRKVVGRAVNRVLDTNALLEGRVDLESDRVSGASKYLLGAKHVADILRSLAVGTGRVGKALEQELDDKAMAQDFEDFVGALVDSCPDLEALLGGEITPSELRMKSLLGSSVILRAFAVAWHGLKSKNWNNDKIQAGFASMADKMGPVFPATRDSWFRLGVFPYNEEGTTSPTSRAQDFKTLSNFIIEACEGSVDWYRADRADDPEEI